MTDDLTPERARETLAADGQEVTDFTDAILAQWQRDRDCIATVVREARIHAQDARTANASLAECYRAVMGGAGEPGSWHGAKPIVSELGRLRARLATVTAQRDALVDAAQWAAPLAAFRAAGLFAPPSQPSAPSGPPPEGPMPTNETPTLLPCPFCGCEATIRDGGNYSFWYVGCQHCGADGFAEPTSAEAAAAWNARQLDPATLALARLGAVFAQAELDGHANLEKVRIALYATHNTPGIRERVAELLDTEARERREDTP